MWHAGKNIVACLKLILNKFTKPDEHVKDPWALNLSTENACMLLGHIRRFVEGDDHCKIYIAANLPVISTFSLKVLKKDSDRTGDETFWPAATFNENYMYKRNAI